MVDKLSGYPPISGFVCHSRVLELRGGLKYSRLTAALEDMLDFILTSTFCYFALILSILKNRCQTESIS